MRFDERQRITRKRISKMAATGAARAGDPGSWAARPTASMFRAIWTFLSIKRDLDYYR